VRGAPIREEKNGGGGQAVTGPMHTGKKMKPTLEFIPKIPPAMRCIVLSVPSGVAKRH
jgi:hypothetical protein